MWIIFTIISYFFMKHADVGMGGDSCRNGNTCDARTLTIYNCNVYHFGNKMLLFWDETTSKHKSPKMKV